MAILELHSLEQIVRLTAPQQALRKAQGLGGLGAKGVHDPPNR